VLAVGLDVLENENMAKLTEVQRRVMEALMSTGRVLFTPHIGGWSHESLKRINQAIVDHVVAFVCA
jgi:D-3-phosphoglycerate dehydrogenase